MATKPEITSFNQFIQLNWEMFVPYELWITDELTEYLVNKRDLDKTYTSVVIDLDRDEPLYGYREDNIYLRFNGRFYIPMEDKNIKKLNMTSEQWLELFEIWAKEQEVEIVLDESVTDLIKFTLIIPVMSMPEEAPSPKGTEESTEKGTEVEKAEEAETEEGTEESNEEMPEESETPSEEETESKESKGPEEEPEESKDTELKEFEEALGL